MIKAELMRCDCVALDLEEENH